MQIKINEHPLDFTLERDETLGEVVQELKSWLKGSNLVLYSVRHRDRDLLASPSEEWESTPHAEIDQLDVTVRGARELQTENLQTVLEYLDLLDKAVVRGNDSQLAELGPGFAAMRESVAQFARGEASLEGLSRLLAAADGQPVAAWPPEWTAQARSFVGRLASLVEGWLREIQDPRAVAVELVDALASCRDEAGQVAVLLQTGRDREAMQTIVRFSELSQRLARVLHTLGSENASPPTVAGKSLEVFYRELNGFLAELVEAFSAQDSVLIGDLMEYEIAPRLEQLRVAIEEGL